MNYKDELNKLLNNSYSPYSNYKVAAIVVMKDGKWFNGVNVENAAYGNAICAERNAIHTAITNGYKPGDFKEMYLMAKVLGYSCGACRQTMQEFFDADTKIISMSSTGETKELLFKDLLPYPFGPEDLK